MKNNNLFKKYINILWICPLAVTAPRRIREPAAERKRECWRTGHGFCTKINEYCMKWRSLLFRTSFQLFHKTDFETGIIFRNFASLKISDMLWKQKRYIPFATERLDMYCPILIFVNKYVNEYVNKPWDFQINLITWYEWWNVLS